MVTDDLIDPPYPLGRNSLMSRWMRSVCKLAGPLRLTATPKGRISEWLAIHQLSGIYGSEAPALQVVNKTVGS